MLPISDAKARAFALALVANGGNLTAAARTLGYDNPRSAGHALSRHPAVAKHLQVEAQAELQSLTPKAVRTIAGLLTNKSGYIRLDAAKEVLRANNIGIAKDKSNTQPLLISIQIGDKNLFPSQSGPAEVPVAEASAEVMGADHSTQPSQRQILEPSASEVPASASEPLNWELDADA